MKKSILTLAMLLTIGSVILAGTSMPVSAIIGPEIDEMVSSTVYEVEPDEIIYTNYDYAEESHYATVEGAKTSLALRTDPSDNDDNIVGTLQNGDTVEVLDLESGDYVWVYSEKYGCGWVDGNYLK